jgi:hypothetical protein
MIVIEVMPSPDRHDNPTIQHGTSFLGSAPDVTRAIFLRASKNSGALLVSNGLHRRGTAGRRTAAFCTTASTASMCWRASRCLPHCGDVINRLLEMTSRKIPRNMERKQMAMTTHKNSRKIPRTKIFLDLNRSSKKMMGYSKAPTSCACPPLSAPALDHFTHFSTISVAAKPRTAAMRNIFVAVGISVRNSIISLPPLLGDLGAEQWR